MNAKRPPLEDLGDRVWFALHCLPRDQHHRPPPPTRFEAPQGEIPRGTLGKVISGKRAEVERPTLVKIAEALHVSVGFLANGEEPWPTPTGDVPPRPRRFDANKKPVAVGTAFQATGVVFDRLGIDDEDGDYISTPGEHDMNRLPPDGRDAAMATVYLEGCSVKDAVEAAVAALAMHGAAAFGMGPEGWMKPIREVLYAQGIQRKRSSVRRLQIVRPPAENE